jgi:hypothetical protein
MATLTGNAINTSYTGLIKTTDNAGLTGTEKAITDGVGTPSTLSLGTTSASFTGDLDLSGATVTGLPPGGVSSVVAGTNVTVDNTDPANPIVSASSAAGLVAGTGLNSMKSADSLTSNPALGGGEAAIALGNGAIGNQDFGIAIGSFTSAAPFGMVVGSFAESNALYGVALGPSARTGGGADGSIAIGQASETIWTNGSGEGAICLGRSTKTRLTDQISIGDGAECAGTDAAGAVALGAGVFAETPDTVTIKKLQMLDYASLNFADDTAAAANGIPLGGVYHTSGTLKIRIAS